MDIESKQLILGLAARGQDAIIIAVDAMGGDKAPEAIISGLEIFLENNPGIKVFFEVFGNENLLNILIKKCKLLPGYCNVNHTAEAVSNDDKPSYAIRNAKNSSMQLAINLVKNGNAHAVFSAGNTGVLMAMAKISLRTINNISRPAIAGIVPNKRGSVVMLDLGANTECDANNLYQFALMGEAFARIALRLESPKIALLNVGHEETKGKDSIKLASALIRESSYPLNFIGFVEGSDILEGTADVIVADGFSGNIALKSIEGAARYFRAILKKNFTKNLFSIISYWLAWFALKQSADDVDPRKYNGAMFIGLNGIVVKSHGGMDEQGHANAIKIAYELAKQKINEQISDEISNLSSELSKGEFDV